MSNFFVELWEGIFQPGPTPQLVIATHVSFTSLLSLLASLLYVTRNIHVAALSLIALFLWITVTWFINEFQHAATTNNDKDHRPATEDGTSTQNSPIPPSISYTTANSTTTSSNPRPRAL
ncbi:Pkr1p Ecym_6082 [Eremothecium cymbalariae DBVPG|uniref:V-type ATPase assembly factor PKR1 n=1 Tax=Eremothecium cymbalariae (strain CBS 270.75 / DBVPG 7215 / KCTC 17166 / NRRL Y-17582) TaxID=931890 RepID=G8JUZ9_ERECY|nr:hypothetical protein Ecym_6082 [Eremothecium cymbalariae DBVPG\